jgi:5-methylcytosine-specific restriction endonuclease McrA
VVVDHIRPIRHHWELRLDINNLQLLCDDCNKGKGSTDETDWRDLRPLSEAAE